MSHLSQLPPPNSGGGSRTSEPEGGPAEVTVKWVSSHALTPRQYFRRLERAEAMRLAIEAMLEAPAGQGEHDE